MIVWTISNDRVNYISLLCELSLLIVWTISLMIVWTNSHDRVNYISLLCELSLMIVWTTSNDRVNYISLLCELSLMIVWNICKTNLLPAPPPSCLYPINSLLFPSLLHQPFNNAASRMSGFTIIWLLARRDNERPPQSDKRQPLHATTGLLSPWKLSACNVWKWSYKETDVCTFFVAIIGSRSKWHLREIDKLLLGVFTQSFLSKIMVSKSKVWYI